MQPPELARGSNTVLAPIGALNALVVDVSWISPDLECHVCALVCDSSRSVLDDNHFLFWDNPAIPGRSVVLRSLRAEGGSAADRSQVLVALGDLPSGAERVVVSLSTVESGADLRQVQEIQVRAWDPVAEVEVAIFEPDPSVISTEACLVLAEVYQHGGSWKFKAVGQGYRSGLAGLGRDYGVNIVD